MPRVLKKGKGEYGRKRRGYKRRVFKKKSTKGDIYKLKRQVRQLQKTAAPEWLTKTVPQQALTTNSSLLVNQDTLAMYIGPYKVGNQAADGAPDHEEFSARFLELSILLKSGGTSIGTSATSGPSGSATVAWSNSTPYTYPLVEGVPEWNQTTKVRVILVRQKTPGSLLQAPPLALLMNTNTYNDTGHPTDFFYNYTGGFYTEYTGGKSKNFWIMHDEVIDLKKVLNFVPNPGNTLTTDDNAFGWYVGEYLHRIKLDLRRTPLSKVETYDTSNNTILSYTTGMYWLYLIGDGCGQTTSPYRWGLNIGGKVYADVYGRFCFQSK